VPFHGINFICFHFASELLDQGPASVPNRAGIFFRSDNFPNRTSPQEMLAIQSRRQHDSCPDFTILFNSAHSLKNIKSEIAQLLVQVATNCPRLGAFTTNSL
jgi:hypothetical protein